MNDRRKINSRRPNANHLAGLLLLALPVSAYAAGENINVNVGDLAPGKSLRIW